MMSVIIAVVIAAFLLVLLGKFLEKDVKEMSLPENELLRFFTVGERLRVMDLSSRIKERTAGKRDIPYAILYQKLDKLVEKSLLLKEEEKVFSDIIPDGLDVIYYSLPSE